MNRNLRFRLNRSIISMLGIFLIPGAAIAHHAEWMENRPFIQGLSMPVHGLDHMLVTFAVGLIAVQIGGSALWAVPTSFSMLLLLGGVTNVSGIGVPFVEHAIFTSLIVLGGLLAYRKQLPLLLGLAVVAFFAMFHGVALVAEAPHNAWFLVFATGCLIAAWAVLGSGMLAGFFLKKLNQNASHRVCWMGNYRCRGIDCYFPGLK